MARPRRTAVLVAVLALSFPFAPGSVRATTMPTVVPTADSVDVPDDSVTDTTTGWRLENDPSECINSNPRPNCGYKPQDAGERGGALQVTLFFVLMGAIGVIGTVIVRNVIKRDRAIAERLRSNGDQSSAPPGGASSPPR